MIEPHLLSSSRYIISCPLMPSLPSPIDHIQLHCQGTLTSLSEGQERTLALDENFKSHGSIGWVNTEQSPTLHIWISNLQSCFALTHKYYTRKATEVLHLTHPADSQLTLSKKLFFQSPEHSRIVSLHFLHRTFKRSPAWVFERQSVFTLSSSCLPSLRSLNKYCTFTCSWMPHSLKIC